MSKLFNSSAVKQNRKVDSDGSFAVLVFKRNYSIFA